MNAKIEGSYQKSRSRIDGFKDFTEKPISRSLGRGIFSSLSRWKELLDAYLAHGSGGGLTKVK